ncbi:MAG: PEP-CTERM sorting domain-containing protein [Rubrivivax sp.]|jgi:hypothetical protein|nr:PEP-CTERM sorting domain-containing protein [Rubrivivax sp.]
MKTLTLKAAAAVSMLAASSASMALLEQPGTLNAELLFVAIDSTGTPTQFTADLSFNLLDFDSRGDATGVFDGSFTPGPRGALLALGTTVQWDFNTNTVSLNGAVVDGPFTYSSNFANFLANSQREDTRFGVISMSTGSYPEFFMTTGNPTAAQLAQQTPGLTNNLGAVGAWYGKLQNKGSHLTALHGSNTMVNNTSDLQGWALGGGNLGVNGNWATNLRWSALVAQGTESQFYFLEAGEIQYKDNLGGTFSYDNGVLTWAVPIPEPGTYAMLLAGLALVGGIARRRLKA